MKPSGLLHESSYPAIKIPVRMVYTTSKLPNPIVTFQHIEHLELFEFDCVDCHKDDNCSNCHDQSATAQFSSSNANVHELCSGCHDLKEDCPETDCVLCHNATAQDPVFHQIVGNTLPKYCERLGCSGCHAEEQEWR